MSSNLLSERPTSDRLPASASTLSPDCAVRVELPAGRRAALPARPSRAIGLDAARAVAGALIVWCHVNTTFHAPGESYSWIAGTFGVPFYLFVALLFVVIGFTRDPDRSVGTYLLGRVRKLYLPFLIWTLAYAALTWAKNRQEGFRFPAYYLYSGSYTHLYFLPLLLASTAVLTLLVVTSRGRPRFAACAVVTLVLLAFAAAYIDVPTALDDLDPARGDLVALYDFWRAAPAALGAMAFALFVGRSGRRLEVARSVSLVGAAVTVLCVAAQMIGRPAMLARTLSGFGWTLLAFGPWRMAWLRPLAVVGRHSFGIYLAHVAFIRAADATTRGRGVEITLPVELAIFAFSFFGAFVLSALLARWPATEWIVGYEGEKVRRTLGQPTRATTPSTPETPTIGSERTNG